MFSLPKDHINGQLIAGLKICSVQRCNCKLLICKIQFEDCQYIVTNKERPNKNALPTLFNCPNPPEALTLKQKVPRYLCQNDQEAYPTELSQTRQVLLNNAY